MELLAISIALATYNGERYLRQQLRSYLSQSRVPDQLVVCDDCSTDTTIKMLEEFASLAPFPVVLIRNDCNIGTGLSFSRAIGLCKGDIIVFSDQDDEWLPNKLEEIEQTFIDKPCVSYVISNALIVDDELNSLGYTLWKQRKFSRYWQKQFDQGHELEVFLRLTITTGMTTAIRSHLRGFGPPEPSNINHDAWYIPLAAIFNYQGTLIKKPLVKYRQHAVQQYGATNNRGLQRIKCAFTNNYISIIHNIKLHESLINFIHTSHINPKSLSVYLLQDKLDHLYKRKLINEIHMCSRFFRIFEEIKQKRYRKYGSWKNIIVDVLS